MTIGAPRLPRFPPAEPGAGGVGAAARMLVAMACIGLLCGCATRPPGADRVEALPPLELDDRVLTLDRVAEQAPTPDLLALDGQMRDFVQRYTADARRDRERLISLHRAIRGAATLGIDYDPQAGGTASDVFYRGTANCLSYASLLVAMAREAGLDASYQWLDLRPQWSRSGERVLVRLHVNVDVNLKRGERFMADIDPLSPARVTGSRLIADSDAQALHHSNIAMQALAGGDTGQAWFNAVRALQLSPAMAHLWVNLGAVYRAAGQFRAAEDSYRQALSLDPGERSAMNNLVVLFRMEGRDTERAYWEARVAGYRDANPYYHAWLGDEAASAGDWEGARRRYEEAVTLSSGDSRLLYSLGKVLWQLGDQVAASRYLERAIESASLRSEIMAYRAQLEAWRQASGDKGLFAER